MCKCKFACLCTAEMCNCMFVCLCVAEMVQVYVSVFVCSRLASVSLCVCV